MDDHNEDREKLRSIQAIFEDAVKNNTIDDLKPYADPEFSFVSFTDRSFSDFDTFSKQWSSTRKEMVGSGSFITHLEPDPSLFVDDIAVCSGNSQNSMVNNKGVAYEFTSHWTVVFKCRKGEWKILRAHNSLNPFSNPMLKHAVKTRILKTSLLAFILGGAICFLLIHLIQL